MEEDINDVQSQVDESVKAGLAKVGEFAGEGNNWLFQVTIGALCLMALLIFIRLVLGFLQKRLGKSESYWNRDLFFLLRLPLSTALWLVGSSYLLEILLIQFEFPLRISYFAQFRNVVTIVCMAWFVLSYIRRVRLLIIRDIFRGTLEMERGKVDAMAKLASIFIFVVTGLLVLDALGLHISALLAVGGVGGIAVAFAAQDVVANFFGGLMIHITQPFSIGDWINSPERSFEGTVEEIGWYATRIRSFDKRPIYVPNAVFPKVLLVNPSRMLNRRIREHITLRYQDIPKVRAIVTDIENMLKEHSEIDKDQALMVYMDRFADYSVDILVYTFTISTRWAEWLRIKQDVLLKIADIVEKHGAGFAFPTSTVEVPEGLNLQVQKGFGMEKDPDFQDSHGEKT
ncbi:MAG: mechanosensitive ion channel protein MscS [Waddliaceae bacterium]|nr:mechanosensitive ion channel protein MscS [Waddliaceae bacterium]